MTKAKVDLRQVMIDRIKALPTPIQAEMASRDDYESYNVREDFSVMASKDNYSDLVSLEDLSLMALAMILEQNDPELT